MPDPIGLPRADTLSTSAPARAGRACSEARTAAAPGRTTGCEAADRASSPFGDAMAEARQAWAHRPAKRADDAPDDAPHDAPDGAADDSGDRGAAQTQAARPEGSSTVAATLPCLHQDNAAVVLPAAVPAASPPATQDADTAPAQQTPPAAELAGSASDEDRCATPAAAVAPLSGPPFGLPFGLPCDSANAANAAPAGASLPSAAAAQPATVPQAIAATLPIHEAGTPPAGSGETAAAADTDTGDAKPAEAAPAAGRAVAHAARRDPGDAAAPAASGARRPEFAVHLARIDDRARPYAGDPDSSATLPHPAAVPVATHLVPGGARPVLASVATPLGHPGFADRFAGEIGALALRGISQAEIVLNPRELGPVRIELSLNGESARIAFSAAQPETRHAIEQTLPVLKDLLANHGLTLSDTSVSDGRAGDDRKSGFAFGQSGAHADAGASTDPGGSAPHGAALRRPIGLRGLVDLYA